MRLSSVRAAGLAGLVALGLALAPPSQAALGGDVASAMHDHERLGVAAVVTSTTNYDMYEGQTVAGARLREYVARGRVFAVTYEGATRPDLSRVLGIYAARFQAATVARRPGSHHVLAINDPDFSLAVVHMGRGWRLTSTLPAAIPAGVDRRELR